VWTQEALAVFVEVPFENGDSFLVESDIDGGVVRATRGENLVKASTQTFEQSLDQIRHLTTTIVAKLSGLPSGPDHLRAEFGICLGAEAGMAVVKGTGEAHFVLELVWDRRPEE
jgi:hypothetical protein